MSRLGADDDARALARRELETWAPRARVVVLHRSAAAFDAAAKKGPVALAEFLARALSPPSVQGATVGVVLSSYEGLRRLSDAFSRRPGVVLS